MTPVGKFIVFEGLDRSGKTTQCAKTAEFLRKLHTNVVVLKFPDRTTTIGQMINNYLTDSAVELSDQAIHLLFSANRWEIRDKLLGLLNSGTTVIADRYIYSGVAFSAAKGLDFDWCVAPDEGLPLPDKVIFLDIDEKAAMKRGGFGLERYETQEMQEKVRSQFAKLRSSNWSWIDASGTTEQVFMEIKSALELLVNNNHE